jgi:uncharacterized Zn-finger protein
MNLLNLNYIGLPVCPYCGKQYKDAGELYFGGDSIEIECEECGKSYRAFHTPRSHIQQSRRVNHERTHAAVAKERRDRRVSHVV